MSYLRGPMTRMQIRDLMKLVGPAPAQTPQVNQATTYTAGPPAAVVPAQPAAEPTPAPVETQGKPVCHLTTGFAGDHPADLSSSEYARIQS